MTIILGVTGCIAAYKAALILRLLQKQGFDVQPVMTRSAREFLGPLTLEKLSGNKVISDLFGDEEARIQHIAIARKGALLLVAPATANIIAKFAAGIADDFLSTLFLSTTSPVLVAPAMNVEMWRNPATQANLAVLKSRGVGVIEPGVGYQACGESGEGRLAEPETIIASVASTLSVRRSLAGRKVLVTAGPTIEDLDPVRYFSNRSSGKMGYALAREAASRGAEVLLVSGPTSLDPPAGVELASVRSAAEMAERVFEAFDSVDVVVKAAAVADFTPFEVSPQKVKKGEELIVRFRQTIDILSALGQRKGHQLLVGFAAESERLEEYARRKLEEKKLDLIVANDISNSETGFESDWNQVTLIDGSGREQRCAVERKDEVARRIWDRIEQLLAERRVSVASL